MRKTMIVLLAVMMAIPALAQKKKQHRLLEGMYLQWGYNTEWYTKSTIHFLLPGGTNFRVHNVSAKDRPDLDAIYKKPKDVSIPQYNYRIGFYLNKKHSRALELNFDHAKYIVYDGQVAHVEGTIDGKSINADTLLDPKNFLHFEHTDGANWLHINYVQQHTLLMTKKHRLLTYVWKAGAGINIPRSDFTWRGKRLNNDFHVAGYNMSVEGGLRLYPLKKFFIETTGKTGYVRYVNALANSPELKDSRARHSFGYFEFIATIGYDIKF